MFLGIWVRLFSSLLHLLITKPIWCHHGVERDNSPLNSTVNTDLKKTLDSSADVCFKWEPKGIENHKRSKVAGKRQALERDIRMKDYKLQEHEKKQSSHLQTICSTPDTKHPLLLLPPFACCMDTAGWIMTLLVLFLQELQQITTSFVRRGWVHAALRLYEASFNFHPQRWC